MDTALVLGNDEEDSEEGRDTTSCESTSSSVEEGREVDFDSGRNKVAVVMEDKPSDEGRTWDASFRSA